MLSPDGYADVDVADADANVLMPLTKLAALLKLTRKTVT
jgi:hypothetical protein